MKFYEILEVLERLSIPNEESGVEFGNVNKERARNLFCVPKYQVGRCKKMKASRLAVLFAAFTAAICLSSIANAQPGRGGFGGGGLASILGIEGVDKELDLTDDQQIEVKDFIAEIQEFAQKERQESIGEFNFQNATDEERAEFRKKMEKVTAKVSKKEKEEIGEILLKPQLERLEELRIQLAGVGALSDPAVIEKLAISKDQQEKIQDVQEKVQAEMRAAFTGGNVDREKLTQLRADSEKQILAVLDESQQKKFEELKGKPFEFPQRQGGGRGQRGNRPQGGRPQSN